MPEEKGKKSILNLITNLWQEGKGGKKKNYLLLSLLLLGIILMFASSFFAPHHKPPADDKEEQGLQPLLDMRYTYECELTEALEGVLEHIDGISNVHAFISFRSSEEVVYAQSSHENTSKTTETDREGGAREIYESTKNSDYVVLRDAGGGEKPLQLTKNMPDIKGVMVVAEGADNTFLRLKVVRAIQSVLDLPVHRIAVLPRSSNQ